MGPIDFRSDTLTQPDKTMRRIMANAEVGDDYYREDPTIREIEEFSADLLGKEAALFVLSGTMGNLVSVRAQVPTGSGAVVGDNSHIYINETGHLATVCGITVQPRPTPNGKLSIADLEASIAIDDKGSRSSVLNPPMRLVCVENTHNAEGGRCLDVDYLQKLGAAAVARSMVFHMDGARLFNAAVSLETSAAALVKPVHSVTFCLSKGLGAPGGAVVAGDRDFVAETRHWRQMVGGGMRQAGILAAGGLHALHNAIPRLAEDHENARLLARGLRDLGLHVEVAKVETNIVMAFVPETMMPAKDFFEGMAQGHVRTLPPKGTRIRFVTHNGVTSADVNEALRRIASVVETATAGRKHAGHA